MENEFLLPPVFGEEYEEQPRPRTKKKVKKLVVVLRSLYTMLNSTFARIQ